MDIEDSDSDYKSGVYSGLSERLSRHRQPIKDYSSDGSDEDSGLDHPCALSAPEPIQALPCDHNAIAWERFRKMVPDGVQKPPSVCDYHSEKVCKQYMDDMYLKASSSVMKEEETSHRF